MDEAAILGAVTAALRQVFEDDTLSPNLATTPADVAGWDSLRTVLILAMLEERFALRFTTAEMDDMRCVGDLVHAIARHAGPAATA
jgi:acyl carrier protein